MKLIGLGLCLIGVGIIGYDVIFAVYSKKTSRKMPKGRPPGEYEIDDEWSFPEE